MHIRMMAEPDKIVLSKIYLEGIEEGNATFETSIDRKAWFIQLDQSKVIVLENKKELVGFIKLTPISSRKVYKGVNEVSLYIRGDERGKGYGSKLLSYAINFAENNGIWMLQSHIFPENVASLSLQTKHGFIVVGRRQKIAQLNGVWRDTLLLERRSKKIY